MEADCAFHSKSAHRLVQSHICQRDSTNIIQLQESQGKSKHARTHAHITAPYPTDAARLLIYSKRLPAASVDAFLECYA